MTRDLFNLKTIERLCQDIVLTDEQKDNAQKWLKLLKENKLKDEEPNEHKFAPIVLEKILGYEQEKLEHEKTNKQSKYGGRVEFQYKFSNQKTICFETKGTKTKDLFARQQNYPKKEQSTPVNQLWGYMQNAEFGICTNYKEFILFMRDKGTSKYHRFDFETIGTDESKLREFIGIFSKKQIENDFVSNLHIESYNEEKEFTKDFYKLFHETRLMLIKEFQNNGSDKSTSIYISQIILNRLIFIFFVDDRGFVRKKELFRKRIKDVLKSNQINVHSKKIYNEILELFVVFDKGLPSQDKKSKSMDVIKFNGGLFSGKLPENIHFNDLHNREFFSDVMQNSNITEDHIDEETKKIAAKYVDLNPIIFNLLIMESFNFNTEVDVDILGHIFEQSISDIEILQGNTQSNKKNEGVYYTPEHITDYICRNTIIPYLSKNGTNDVFELVDEYENDIEVLENKSKHIKILDPACGSGAFLIKAIDILLEINREIQNKRLRTHSSGQKQITEDFDEESQIRFFIENNIYGVDLKRESVEIAQLSVFLKTASKTRPLTNMSNRIKVGNSLIDEKNIDPNAFDWNETFAEILNPLIPDRGFDIIVGNPPYVQQEDLVADKTSLSLPPNHTLQLPENFVIDSKSDLSCYFHCHALNLLKTGGILGFISSDSWLHFGYGKNIHKLFLNNCNILEITKLDFKIFEDADVSPAIMLLKRQLIENHNVLFKTGNKEGFESDKFTIMEKPQKDLSADNWNIYFEKDIPAPKIEMMKMQDVGFIKRGKTTGCNSFFVLTKEIIEKYGIAEKYRKPVISKNTHEGLLIDDDVSEYLLNVNDSKGTLVKSEDGKKVLKYIEYGEKTKIESKQGKIKILCLISELPSVKTRQMWYSLNLNDPPKIFLSQIIYKKVKIFENNNNFHSLDVFTYFTPFNELHTHSFLAYFSSSYLSLYLEKMGHVMGAGALKFQVVDYKKLQVPNFDKLSKKDLERMSKAWLGYREDFNRKKLDDVVFSILEFNEDEKNTILNTLECKINKRSNKNK